MTSISTVVAVLMRAANAGEPITSKAAFNKAEKGYDGTFAVLYARAVQMVIDNDGQSARLNLPDGFIDTLAFANDFHAAQQYFYAARAHSWSSYLQSLTTLYDNVMSLGPPSSDLSGTYYFSAVDGVASEGRMTLDPLGTGQWIDETASMSFDWQKTDSALDITFKAGGELISTQVIDDRIMEIFWLSTQGRWVYDGQQSVQWVFNHVYRLLVTSSDGVDVDLEVGGHSDLQALKETAVIAPNSVFELDKTYALALPNNALVQLMPAQNPLLSTQSAQLQLSANNASLRRLNLDDNGDIFFDTLDLPWQVLDNGNMLLGNDLTQGLIDLTVLRKNEGHNPYTNALFEFAESDDTRLSFAQGGSTLLTDESLQWQAASVPGIYAMLLSKTTPVRFDWVEIYADGTALSVVTDDFNENGKSETYNGEILQMPGRWQIDDSGALSIRRYRNFAGDYCTPDAYAPPQSADCKMFHELSWTLHQLKNNEYHVSQLSRSYENDESTRHFVGGEQGNRRWDKLAQRPTEF